jgi:hypothetical protein
MKVILLPVIGLWCLLLSAKAGDNQASHIEVIDSYNKRFVIHSYADGSVDDSAMSYVKLRIINPTYFDIYSETDLLLSNSSKTAVDKSIIFQNADRTIMGFMASVARATYKIILVYISRNGETVINQNFNLKVAEVLRKGSPNIKFYADELCLDHIVGRNLYIAYRSDSGKGFFKFQVRLQPDGQLQMIPNSLKFDN